MRVKSWTIIYLAITLTASSVAVAQTRSYKNEGSKPFCITSVGWQGWGPDQDWAGKLCVDAKETMEINPGPLPSLTLTPVSGAGFYKADSGSHVDIAVSMGSEVIFEGKECDCVLSVGTVGWDHKGQLTTVTELRPYLKMNSGKTKIAITSDVKNPKIDKGNLYFKLEGHGQTEYWATIKFGKIVAIGKTEEKTVSEPKAEAEGKTVSLGETKEPSKNNWLIRGVVLLVILAALVGIFIWKRNTESVD